MKRTKLRIDRPHYTDGGIELPRVDGRTVAARRFRDIVTGIEREIGSTLTEIERSTVREMAMLMLRADQLQAAVVRGESINDDALIRLAGQIRRQRDALDRLKSKRQDPTMIDDGLADVEQTLPETNEYTSLKAVIVAIADRLGVTKDTLYEHQRKLVRDGVITPIPGMGPGRGVRATPAMMAVFFLTFAASLRPRELAGIERRITENP